MDGFWQSWFPALVRGLNGLDEPARSAVLGECGRACARPVILPTYRALLEEAGGADAFFTLVGRRINGVATQCVTADAVYDLLYPRCGCPLYEEGGVEDPALCECSRQSLLWLMRELFPDRDPAVEVLESVLCGNPRCRLRVTLRR